MMKNRTKKKENKCFQKVHLFKIINKNGIKTIKTALAESASP